MKRNLSTKQILRCRYHSRYFRTLHVGEVGWSVLPAAGAKPRLCGHPKRVGGSAGLGHTRAIGVAVQPSTYKNLPTTTINPQQLIPTRINFRSPRDVSSPNAQIQHQNTRSDDVQEHQKSSLTGIAGLFADLFLTKFDNTNTRGSGRHHEVAIDGKFWLEVKRDEEHQILRDWEVWRGLREEKVGEADFLGEVMEEPREVLGQRGVVGKLRRDLEHGIGLRHDFNRGSEPRWVLEARKGPSRWSWVMGPPQHG